MKVRIVKLRPTETTKLIITPVKGTAVIKEPEEQQEELAEFDVCVVFVQSEMVLLLTTKLFLLDPSCQSLEWVVCSRHLG